MARKKKPESGSVEGHTPREEGGKKA